MAPNEEKKRGMDGNGVDEKPTKRAKTEKEPLDPPPAATPAAMPAAAAAAAAEVTLNGEHAIPNAEAEKPSAVVDLDGKGCKAFSANIPSDGDDARKLESVLMDIFGQLPITFEAGDKAVVRSMLGRLLIDAANAVVGKSAGLSGGMYPEHALQYSLVRELSARGFSSVVEAVLPIPYTTGEGLVPARRHEKKAIEGEVATVAEHPLRPAYLRDIAQTYTYKQPDIAFIVEATDAVFVVMGEVKERLEDGRTSGKIKKQVFEMKSQAHMYVGIAWNLTKLAQKIGAWQRWGNKDVCVLGFATNYEQLHFFIKEGSDACRLERW
jgi:hypothetical protein